MIGVGGVGLNAIGAARIAGASPIIAVDVRDGVLRRARAFGATDVVNSSCTDAVAAVRELTGGGVRHALDVVGVAATAEQALRMTALGGGVHLVGLAAGRAHLKLSLPRLLLEQKRIQGLVMGSGDPRRDIPRYADLYLRGRMNLDDLVSRRIGLHEIDAADVRVLGAVGVVQLDHPVDVAKATEAALEQGVWLRPFRDLIYTMPPYVCSDDDIATICAGIAAAAEAG